MRNHILVTGALIASFSLLSGCEKKESEASTANTPTTPTATEQIEKQIKQEPITPIEFDKNVNQAKAELGKKMYFDPRLSKSGMISCNTCHNLGMGGSDNLPTSIGHKWAKGPINAPTVLNSKYFLAQFWDGRAKDLQEQAGGPIQNPIEMGSTHKHAVAVIGSIPQYQKEFEQVYGQGTVDIARITDSIAEFEKTLVTPNSRFDKWLKGDETALSDQEKAGYQLFKSSGCIACHNGPAVGGASFQKVGVFSKYTTRNTATGRFGVTKKESDRNVFKVPTLRNIELTYPYFHDGEVKSLEDAVNIMGKIQLNKEFNEDQTAQMVAFLKSLTGDQPKMEVPILPPSNNTTPLPEPFGK